MTSYSQDEVFLTVLRLTGIKISVATTRILAGSELSIHAVGLSDEFPFAFASSLPGLVFQWSSTNMDVVSLASVYEKAGVSLQEEQDFAARLRSHNPGQATIKLVVSCPTGLCQPDKQVFHDEVKVEVISPLTLLHPRSGRLLIPHQGHAKILTSRDGFSKLSYKLFCDGAGGGGGGEGVVWVGEEGEIVASSVNGHAVVIVTASEEDTGLNQSAIVHVEVGTVVGLSLSPLSLAQATPNSKHHAFPLGYSAEFRVTLLDGSGRAFDFADIPVGYRLNRFDIVRVTPGTNGTYIVKAAAKGQVILRVSLSLQPRISDYIRVHVGYAIIPSLAVVHVGAKVCFTTHLTEESSGEWSTGEGGVMHLSPGTGVGTARSPGRAVIYHKIKGVSDTHTEITVKRVAEVGY
ncbi:Nuclear pore membrane glycoprotein 210-like [Geodia barretti]|uniref:Nuclear pore membrane glycoprotein 210-like n=1 Tax=Geodia barretti TaxID=519541 RepID=A0AA35W819_GEOBA|nr:Nuclear pore membrane glycoprotein 210-like [Geodia barretti]